MRKLSSILTSSDKSQQANGESKPLLEERQGVDWYVGSAILVNALVGAGILNFPSSIHAAGGIAISLCVQTAMVSLIWTATVCMVWCSQQRDTRLYQDTVHAYLGSVGRWICIVFIFIDTFILSINYFVAINDQLKAALAILLPGSTSFFTSHLFTTLALTLLVILPLCTVSHIDRLARASELANLSIVVVAGVVVYQFFATDRSNVQLRTSPTKWTDVFLSVPTYALAYGFDVASVAVYGRLKQRNVSGYVKASSLAVCFVYVFYNILGMFAYATFGADIRPNFMSNYKTGSVVTAIAQIFFTFKLCLEYPVYQFLGWTSLRSFAAAAAPALERRLAETERWSRLGVSVVWVGVTAALSFVVPDIDYIIPLSSSTGINLQLTFIGLCTVAAAASLGGGRRLRRFAMQLLGVCLTFVGVCLSTTVFVQYLIRIGFL